MLCLCLSSFLLLLSTTLGAESPQSRHYSMATFSAWGRTSRTLSTVRHIHCVYIVAFVHVTVLRIDQICCVNTQDCAKTEHSATMGECDVTAVISSLLQFTYQCMLFILLFC